MFSATDLKAKAIISATDLFSFDYVKSHIKNATFSYSEVDDKTVRYFIGFTRDSDKWKEFVYMEISKSRGAVQFLDFRLPSGYRMKNPRGVVRCA